MKKIFFVIALLSLHLTASAQYNPFFRFGLKGGVNLSNISGNDLKLGSGGSPFNLQDNENRSTGFVGGIYMRFGRAFYIQPEFLFSQKGGRFNVYKDGLTNEQGKLDVRFSNFDVPVLLGFRMLRFLRINAGPVASLRMANNGKIRESFLQYTGPQGDTRYKNGISYGYQAGAGIDLGRLSLDVRYEGNLNDIVNINYNNQTTAQQFGRKSNLWQATLGIAF